MNRALRLAAACGFAVFGGIATGQSAVPPRWTVFETLPEGVIYIDPASITRTGNQADMWVLIDYKQPQADASGKPIRSDTLHYRYDCTARTFTILASSAHAGQMGAGAIIDSNADLKPAPVPSGTTAEDMWLRACARAN